MNVFYFLSPFRLLSPYSKVGLRSVMRRNKNSPIFLWKQWNKNIALLRVPYALPRSMPHLPPLTALLEKNVRERADVRAFSPSFRRLPGYVSRNRFWRELRTLTPRLSHFLVLTTQQVTLSSSSFSPLYFYWRNSGSDVEYRPSAVLTAAFFFYSHSKVSRRPLQYDRYTM